MICPGSCVSVFFGGEQKEKGERDDEEDEKMRKRELGIPTFRVYVSFVFAIRE
jgi:hypothetical protein